MKQHQTIGLLLGELTNLLDLLANLSQVHDNLENIIASLNDERDDERDDEQTDEQTDEIDNFFSSLKSEDDFDSFRDYMQYLSEMKDQLTDSIKSKSRVNTSS